MAEVLTYDRDHQLLNILISGECRISDSIVSVNKIKEMMQIEPKPKAVLVEFEQISEFPSVKEWIYFAQLIAETHELGSLKIILLLEHKTPEDILLLKRITRIQGLELEYDLE